MNRGTDPRSPVELDPRLRGDTDELGVKSTQNTAPSVPRQYPGAGRGLGETQHQGPGLRRGTPPPRSRHSTAPPRTRGPSLSQDTDPRSPVELDPRLRGDTDELGVRSTQNTTPSVPRQYPGAGRGLGETQHQGPGLRRGTSPPRSRHSTAPPRTRGPSLNPRHQSPITGQTGSPPARGYQ